MLRKSLAIIIVNWNGLHHLETCLPSLERQTYKQLQVYVVDNGSTDGSVAYIKKTHPRVKIIETGENLGFTGGNNRGIDLALHDGHEYLLLLNNDTKAKATMASRMVDYMEHHPKVGIIQPKLLLMDHPDILDSCGSYFSSTGFILHVGVEEKDGPMFSKVTPMMTVKGAAILVRRNVFEAIGTLDPDFFAYFEETDFCWRAWLAGWRVVYAPVTEVYHKMGGSTKQIGSPTINFHSYKNRIMSLIKNLGIWDLIWILPFHLLLIIGFSFVYFAALRGRSGFSIYRAIGWNVLHIRQTWQKRRQIQSSRTLSDNELFPIIKKPVKWGESFAFAARMILGKRKVTS